MDLKSLQSGGSATPPSAPGSPSTGWIIPGSPGVTPTSVPGPYWFYQQQAEWANLFAAAGITPNPATLTQVKQALDALYAPLSSGMPVGSIIDFGAETPPTGWLECDGSSLSRTGTYAALFAVIGTLHGAADGAHFNLPDHRGKFKRGWAHGTANDPDRATRTAAATGGATGDHVGPVQGWQIQAHNHHIDADVTNGSNPASRQIQNGVTVYYTLLTSTDGGNQTNPINAAVMSIIKVLP